MSEVDIFSPGQYSGDIRGVAALVYSTMSRYPLLLKCKDRRKTKIARVIDRTYLALHSAEQTGGEIPVAASGGKSFYTICRPFLYL